MATVWRDVGAGYGVTFNQTVHRNLNRDELCELFGLLHNIAVHLPKDRPRPVPGNPAAGPNREMKAHEEAAWRDRKAA